MASWVHLADFTAKIGEQSITLRVTKTDHPYTPYYSWKLGVIDPTRTPPNNLSINLRPEWLNGAHWTEIEALNNQASAAISADRETMKAAITKAESERMAALAGKGTGDPNANTGLRAKGKTARKREKEKRPQS